MATPSQSPTGPGKTPAEVLRSKIEAGAFDVFLCHSNRDKPQVRKIALDLKAQGILPWLDEWELRPGLPWQDALEQQIDSVKTAAVFVGGEGVGPWQHQELAAFLRKFVEQRSPVIPVLLPDAPKEPDLPLFLDGMTWVDFRDSDPDPMERLLWGITGQHGGFTPSAPLPRRTVNPPPEPASPNFFPTPPPTASNLAQTLIGSWQVQIINPFGIVGQMMLQILNNGFFSGQLPTPMGMGTMEGQWQVTAMEQLTLQGRQTLGFQAMPYMTIVQFSQTGPYQMRGMTSAGEQTIWQKVS